MKNTKLSLLGALAIAGGMFFAGCDDPCKDVVCVNGECVEGTCVCDAGYEGTDCGTALNAKFSGSYSLTETCTPSGGPFTYAITVAPKSGTTDEVTFTGLWAEPGFVANGSVSADGLAFTIERQTIGTLTNRELSATGTITADGSTITIAYNAYETGVATALDACTGSMVK